MGKTEKNELDELTIEELREKARLLSEVTGRDEDDILTDLLDDGVLNNSNKADGKDLVEQLKEAAELISTVQNISKEVSENTVLNGGENATEVTVETTLEGDIVDRAIESVQRKAENIKKIGLTLIPIFLLLTGGTMETFGMIDIFGGDESNNYGEDCYPEWFYDEYGYSFENQLEVRYTFIDYQYCDIEFVSGHFIIQLFYEGEMIEDTMIGNQDFTNEISVEHTYFDLEQGQYHYRVEFHTVDCEDGSCEHGDEYFLEQSQLIIIDYQEPELCDAYLINEQAYLLEEDDENDAVKISADVALVQGESNCDSEQFEIVWRLYENNNPSVIKYEHMTWKSGVVSDPDGADYVHHTWDTVDEGSYEPKVMLILNGDVLDEKQIAHTITIETQPVYGCTDSEATNYDSVATNDDGSCEYSPDEPCDVEIQNHYRGHVANDEEQDAILVAFRVVPSNCEDELVEIDVELYQNGYDANYSHWLEVSGDAEYTDVSHTFDSIAIGNSWTPRITVTLDDEQLEQVVFWGIDIVQQEPELCEINIFSITLSTNSTQATIAYDLDCGYATNELQGYNVSVQFLVYEVEATAQDESIEYTTTGCYVQGWISDTKYLTLDNFTSSNATHYDFYWYATWTDGHGDFQMIERMWLNKEISE